MTPLPDLRHGRERAGPVRQRRPIYLDLLPPCNAGCPAGENIQAWLAHAEAGRYEQAWHQLEDPLLLERLDRGTRHGLYLGFEEPVVGHHRLLIYLSSDGQTVPVCPRARRSPSSRLAAVASHLSQLQPQA